MKDLGLYIHIPFCKSKCYYCDFNSYANKEYLQDKYIDCIIRELDLRSPIFDEYRVKTIYIGGGTPTYLSLNNLEKLMANLRPYTSQTLEFSCEANPGTLTYDKLAILKDNGVNRLSIGLQSWSNNILKKLGRIHGLNDFLENYEAARKLDFTNINVDLMFSIEGQSIELIEDTLNNIIALKPEHISSYSLIIEEGTPFFEKIKSGEMKEIDEELDRTMYYLVTNKLKSAGYNRYEISNYAIPNYECKHNIIYWKTGPYLGIGAGAHSYIDGTRFSNECSPEKYIEMIQCSKLPVMHREELSQSDKMSEFMFMGLRMMEGISLDEFKERFGKKLLDVYGGQIESLSKKGLVALRNNRLMLTDIGIDLSNQVFVEFI